MADTDLAPETSVCISFRNNSLLPTLFGEHDSHLTRIEQLAGVSTASRGNLLAITGSESSVKTARTALESLYGKLEKGMQIEARDVDAAIRMAADLPPEASESDRKSEKQKALKGETIIETPRKTIAVLSHAQAEYVKAMREHEVVFGVGPAGTGKTFLAVAQAVHMYTRHQVDRIILCRPVVEAGEKLGYLPGDLKEKVDPYLRPIYDALYDMLPQEKVAQATERGEFEIAPLAFMRGRTLSRAFVILDEAQNTSAMQMKMFLTRLGEGSRMVITGDMSQIDLPRNVTSGLKHALDVIGGLEGVNVTRFNSGSVIRHPLTAKIVEAYEAAEAARGETK